MLGVTQRENSLPPARCFYKPGTRGPGHGRLMSAQLILPQRCSLGSLPGASPRSLRRAGIPPAHPYHSPCRALRPPAAPRPPRPCRGPAARPGSARLMPRPSARAARPRPPHQEHLGTAVRPPCPRGRCSPQRASGGAPASVGNAPREEPRCRRVRLGVVKLVTRG